MPTKKIDDERDLPRWERPRPCRHPEHRPPSLRVYQPGEHEHACPGCGEVIRFSVPETWLGGAQDPRAASPAMRWWAGIAAFAIAGPGCVVSEDTIRACAEACARGGGVLVEVRQDACTCAPATPRQDGGAP